MYCHKCGAHTYVTNSRSCNTKGLADGKRTRTRRCKQCATSFTSVEVLFSEYEKIRYFNNLASIVSTLNDLASTVATLNKRLAAIMSNEPASED